jgi:hypothetical protein
MKLKDIELDRWYAVNFFGGDGEKLKVKFGDMDRYRVVGGRLVRDPEGQVLRCTDEEGRQLHVNHRSVEAPWENWEKRGLVVERARTLGRDLDAELEQAGTKSENLSWYPVEETGWPSVRHVRVDLVVTSDLSLDEAQERFGGRIKEIGLELEKALFEEDLLETMPRTEEE